jgi:protein FAM50
MTDIRRVGDSGVHTVEGAVSGNRAVQLTKQRALQQQHYESIKNKIKVENASTLQNINNKFSTASDTLEQEFRQRTVGLVSADDFRKARQVMEDNKSTEINQLQEAEKKLQADRLKSRELKRKHIASSLSFQLDDDGNADDIGGDGPSTGKPLLPLSLKLKDPSVDTSFLPDKVRDKELSDRKEMLSREWLERQEAIKQEVGFIPTECNSLMMRLMLSMHCVL